MIFYSLIISCLFASFANANANEIENLVNTAQRLDSQVSNSNETIKASEMRLRNISRIFNPVVNIGIGTTSTGSNSWGLENTPRYKESYGSSNYNIALSQSIYNSLKNYDIEEAGVQVEYESNLLQSMINENSKLVLQVILDRYLVLKSIKNTENELYLITQHMDKIENDKSKKIEFYNYKDRKLQASENLINSKTNLAQLNSLLENVVGLDNAKKQFKISNLISLDALALPDPGQLIEDSKTHNINIVLKKSELNLASVRVKRAKPGINPTLDFTVNTTGSMGSPGNSGFKSKTTTFGLQLNMSLLDGGGNSSAYSDAITQLNKASNDLEGLKKTIDKNLSDEYFYFNNLKGLIEIKKNMIKNKKDVMVVNRSMYAGVDDGFLLSADVDYQININDLELQISRLHRDAILNWITLISAGKNIGKTEFDVLSNLIEIE